MRAAAAATNLSPTNIQENRTARKSNCKKIKLQENQTGRIELTVGLNND
jgi:hypothetical protein